MKHADETYWARLARQEDDRNAGGRRDAWASGKLPSMPDVQAGFTIELSDDELKRGKALGLARHRANVGRASIMCAPRTSDERIHVVGAMCELAVTLAEKKPLRCAVYTGDEFRKHTEGADVADWEVKGTVNQRGRLIVPAGEAYEHKRHASTKYLLVRWYSQSRAVQIVGWQVGTVIFQTGHIDHSMPHPAYVAPWLWEYCQPKEAQESCRSSTSRGGY